MWENFSAKGKIEEIGEIKTFPNGNKYITINISLEISKQTLPFYIIDSDKKPIGFHLIEKNFGIHHPYEIGEFIQFDYNIIVKDKGLCKLRIWSIYNREFK